MRAETPEEVLEKLAARFETGAKTAIAQGTAPAILTAEVVAGRRVIVQKPRAPFAIFVGTPKRDAVTTVQ